MSKFEWPVYTLCAGGSNAPAAQQAAARVISVSRANNVAIMLTQFTSRNGAQLRAAVYADSQLSPEQLALLLQARLLPRRRRPQRAPQTWKSPSILYEQFLTEGA